MVDMADEYKKNPGDVLDYFMDWSQWLSNGDTIATSSWAVTSTPTDMTLTTPSPSSTFTTVWARGGTVPNYYTLTNTITTVGGRTRSRSIRIIVTNQ